jgi:hypothetical protein
MADRKSKGPPCPTSHPSNETRPYGVAVVAAFVGQATPGPLFIYDAGPHFISFYFRHSRLAGK